ncbi:MAG: FAD-dependent oxidoreductase [Deltaproteobacteria bacterium]|nr:FAD-dependent oxidoreductase [Deltaproteobacteria bacterium]
MSAPRRPPLADLRRTAHAWREARRAFPRCPENAVARAPHGARVGIVGAGLSGLVAGLELLDRGFTVDVFERSTRIGGRLMSWWDGALGPRPVPIERATHGVWWTYNNLRELLGRHGIPLRSGWVNRDHGGVPIAFPDGRTRHLTVGRGLPSLLHGLPFWRAAQRELVDPGERLGLRQLLALMAFDNSAEAIARYDARTAEAWAEDVGLPRSIVKGLVDPLLDMCNFQGASTSSALAWHRFASTHFADWRDLRVTQFFDGPAGESVLAPLRDRLLARGGRIHLGAEVQALRVRDQRVTGVALAARRGPSLCPACHLPGVSPCRGCGYAGDDFRHPDHPGGEVALDAVIVAVALPAARALLSRAPWSDDPFFARVARLPTANPTIVYTSHPGSAARAAWRRAHGTQEVLFTAGYPTIGTVIDTSLLHGRVMPPEVEIIEADLPRGERFDGLSDDDVVARVLTDLARLVPGLPAPVARRVLRWRDFTTSEVGSEALRPPVVTPVAGLCLVGDWVAVPQNCYYMERCVVSARLAVNALVERFGHRGDALTILPSETPSLALEMVRRLSRLVVG